MNLHEHSPAQALDLDVAPSPGRAVGSVAACPLCGFVVSLRFSSVRAPGSAAADRDQLSLDLSALVEAAFAHCSKCGTVWEVRDA